MNYSKAIQEYLVAFWQAENIEPDYQNMMAIVLSRLWESALDGEERNGKVSLLALPTICCSALGRDPKAALEVNAAWALLYAAFYLLDKIEDQEAYGEIFSTGNGIVINVTTGFILSASLIFSKLEADQNLDAFTISSLRIAYHRMAIAVCAGQHLDFTQQAPDLNQVWRSVTAKSGEFFSLGCLAGAFISTNNQAHLKALATFGRHLGIMIQIANDIEGLWGDRKGESDLIGNRSTLPVAYALNYLPAEKSKKLSQLLNLAKENAGAEAEARSLILGCGAMVYLMLETERHRQHARNVLESMNLQTEDAHTLLSLLHHIDRIKDKLI